jgi:type IV pilus assembly protein PilE
MKSRNKGFTLVELMVTVAVVAIIAAVALPSYRQYIRRANRVDATGALLRLAGNQERFYLQNNTYAAEDLMGTAPPGGLGIESTERGFYDLAMAPAAGGYTSGFTATATVASGGDQADDADCASFTVDETGRRSAADSGGTTSPEITDRCWR